MKRNINNLNGQYKEGRNPRNFRYIVGVDEAGRGPLAGPVEVGVAVVRHDFNWQRLPGVNDSKQLTEKRREEIFALARRLKGAGQINYAVAMVSASVIDQIGIVKAINRAMGRALLRVEKSGNYPVDHWLVKLDGGLRAPKRFNNQETIVKGDSKEKVIGLASILAKVTRDRHMVRLSKIYPEYGFHLHKGYGTRTHLTVISTHGKCPLHRTTYTKKSSR